MRHLPTQLFLIGLCFSIGCDRGTGLSDQRVQRSPTSAADKRSIVHAVLDGNDALAMDLIRSGMPPDELDLVADEEGRTALQLAAGMGRAELVSLLLDARANVNATSTNGQTTPLYAASFFGHTAVVRMLLSRGADPNASNSRGDPPLYWAAARGHPDVVRDLLKGGASPNLMSSRGPALIWAIGGSLPADQSSKIVQILLEGEADPNVSVDGYSMLWRAVSAHNLEAVQLLLKYGAKVDQRAANGDTEITFAAREGCWDIVCLLAHQGVDVNVQDQQGMTALHRAALSLQASTIEVLLAYGAKSNLRDRANGLTPVEYIRLAKGTAEEKAQALDLLDDGSGEESRPQIGR